MAKSRSLDFIGELQDDFTLKLEGSEGASIRHLLSFFKGKELDITFSIHEKNRSAAQNRYIHGVVVPIVRTWFEETTGDRHTHDEVYMWLRVSLLKQSPIIKNVGGEQVIIMEGKRFSKMTTKEFAEAIDLIIATMAERDCPIPFPREENHITKFL
jgi:hypothetical protein